MCSASHPSQARHLGGGMLGTREGHSNQDGLHNSASAQAAASELSCRMAKGGGLRSCVRSASSHPHFAIMALPWFSRTQRVPVILCIWAGQVGPFQYCREGKVTHRNSLPVAPPPFCQFIYFSPPCKDEVCSEPPALLFL